MKVAITTRPAGIDDIELIGRLIRDLAIYQNSGDDCVCTHDAIEEALFSSPPAAEVIIGELDGTPVGFALFYEIYSTFLGRKGLYLEDLFVLPEARGQGLGKALLRKLASVAIERNYARMDWFVLDWNKPSIEFYKTLGAAPLDMGTIFRLKENELVALSGTQNVLNESKIA